MTDLDAALAATARAVERQISELLPERVVSHSRLIEAMRYAALGGGKRLRPIFMFAVGEVGDASPERMMDAACAVELVHAASLVLDDLPSMDDASERRGQPATHVRFGEATALLAVLLLYPATSHAYERYNNGCQGCHGQYADSPYSSPKGGPAWPSSLHTVHRSSSYMNTDCDLCHTSSDGRDGFGFPRTKRSG